MTKYFFLVPFQLFTHSIFSHNWVILCVCFISDWGRITLGCCDLWGCHSVLNLRSNRAFRFFICKNATLRRHFLKWKIPSWYWVIKVLFYTLAAQYMKFVHGVKGGEGSLSKACTLSQSGIPLAIWDRWLLTTWFVCLIASALALQPRLHL